MIKQKSGGLGKGLNALLGEVNNVQQTPETAMRIAELPLNSIDININQARKKFDSEKLAELEQSIKKNGVIQPILVTRNGDRYTIVAGERRYRAARNAGKSSIPALIRSYDERELMEVSLIENLQRVDLNPIEEASGIKLLMNQHDMTHEEISEVLGKSRPTITNSLRLLTLCEGVIDMVQQGLLSAGHARCLIPIEDEELQLAIAKDIAQKGLNVRQTEALINSLGNKKEKKLAKKEPFLNNLQSELQSCLETKVKILGSSSRGKIVIEYFSDEQLNGLFDYLKK